MGDLKDMQTRSMPDPAYRGNEPYVFVSYAHLDSERVLAEIRRFNEAGFHVWYDEGIAPGTEWSDEIAEALSNCSLFAVMLTPTSAPRENVLNEIDYALNEQKPFLAIYLEETTLPPGLKLRISRKQAILKYNMSDQEYEKKIFEAFTRYGLARHEVKAPAKASAILEGIHPFGDYVPKGTAVITTGLGKEFTAIGNSLVYKPVGTVKFQTLHDLVSMERSPNGYVLKDASGRETILKTSPGDELLYLSDTENLGLGSLDPQKLQINMVKTLRVDPCITPERKIRYCDVRTKDGSFKTPREFLFFSVNDDSSTPPVKKLGKDLNRFSQRGYASLLMMKKLTVISAGDSSGPQGSSSAEVTVQYPGNDAETFSIRGGLNVYAMGAGGNVHLINQEDLREIEIL